MKLKTDKRRDVFDEAVEDTEDAEVEALDVAESEDTATEPESDEVTGPSGEKPSDKPSDEKPAETVTSPNQRRGVVLGVAAGILVAALLGGGGFVGWQLWQTKQVIAAGNQARDAAVNYAQVLTSIDSNKVDENFDQVLAGATGEFKDMYSQSSMQLRQLLIENKATAHGVVVESAVQSATKNKAVVLLFVDQSVQNTAVPDPRIDRSRIKMTMEKVDGQWKASKVELP
ncbi:DUF3329 domain-containing protein [Mycolicibacterium smegmatis]|nr:hypothetical protein [Mycolicibacterium smegmatis]MCP2621616.1 DUF3329 domain-containing protein [Mycolicibacterium smegmatis]MDF1899040.1 DUF3329 domain-containing protein [Mycolicibacterium smegmatis]MDF1904864.1 DUF3329 domain-containing protein [Mycolicibacterium smegmatis]MDF1918733.1 DUF3329 domain-containing protein [Mycolicibacterium smegmatis]MDF1924028.1 DUF3329 domain-containing protein [Mycolicibacterium smegmatis]